MFNKFRKGQVGSTLTWIVATVIIIVMLFVTIFVSGNFFDNKKVNVRQDKDTYASKSFFAWLETQDETGNRVYERINIEGVLNENSGGLLAEKIFESYSNQVWIGFLGEDNEHFGKSPRFASTNPIIENVPVLNVVGERVQLAEKIIRLLIFKEDDHSPLENT